MSCKKEECCCKCEFQIKVMCHPCNGEQKMYGFLEDNLKIGKGNINQQLAWGCALPMKEYKENKVIYFDFEHEICEMFTPKEV